jgi:hypothetical protein
MCGGSESPSDVDHVGLGSEFQNLRKADVSSVELVRLPAHRTANISRRERVLRAPRIDGLVQISIFGP